MGAEWKAWKAGDCARPVVICDPPQGSLRAHLYLPRTASVTGLAVLAPGSRGGMGPGQSAQSIGKFDQHPQPTAALSP